MLTGTVSLSGNGIPVNPGNSYVVKAIILRLNYQHSFAGNSSASRTVIWRKFLVMIETVILCEIISPRQLMLHNV